MKIFISGPITGKPDYNKSAFFEAERQLEQMGHAVWNPVKLHPRRPDDFTAADYLAVCYSMIDRSDMLVQLDGWRHSEGAMLEAEYARARDIPIVEIRDLLSDRISSKRNTTQDNSMQP